MTLAGSRPKIWNQKEVEADDFIASETLDKSYQKLTIDHRYLRFTVSRSSSDLMEFKSGRTEISCRKLLCESHLLRLVELGAGSWESLNGSICRINVQLDSQAPFGLQRWQIY